MKVEVGVHDIRSRFTPRATLTQKNFKIITLTSPRPQKEYILSINNNQIAKIIIIIIIYDLIPLFFKLKMGKYNHFVPLKVVTL